MRTRIKIEDLSGDQVTWLAESLPGYFPDTSGPMVTIEFLMACTQESAGTRTMPVRAFMHLIDALAEIERGVIRNPAPINEAEEPMVTLARTLVERGKEFLVCAQNVIDNSEIGTDDKAVHAGSFANLATAQFSGATAMLALDISDRWYQR